MLQNKTVVSAPLRLRPGPSWDADCAPPVPSKFSALIAAIAFTSLASQSLAGSLAEAFIDPDDGWLDASRFLLDYSYAILPVPLIITEPALGQGIGLAGVHFHDTADDAPASEPADSTRTVPRSVSAAAAAATNNDSWFVGGGHIGYYRQDRIRYEGFVGYTDLNLDFYGTAEEPLADGVSFNTEAAGLFQQLAFRLGGSNWFAGAAYLLMGGEFDFDQNREVAGVNPDDLDSSNAALALVVFYDSLDNQYTPRSGLFSDLRYSSFDQLWGGDFDYEQVTWKNQAHTSFGRHWILGLRLDLDMIDGTAPFYGVPFIKLKGIPVLRYQGDKTAVAEARVSWEPHPRWQFSAFAGAGKAADEVDELGDSPSRISRGIGFRYMGVRALGLNIGLDYARGPEDSVVYISFGTRWL